MIPASDRRGFLRGLASLPLIGGSVALIGSPSGSAIQATDDQVALYGAFLAAEHQAVLRHYEARSIPIGSMLGQAWSDHGHLFPEAGSLAHRAPVVLSAAGLPLIGGRHV